MSTDARRVVALGGGHGLAATLRALRIAGTAPTAVVTVADDGGSSGRLRADHGILPPGDLRMALAALCPDTPRGAQVVELLQHRFSGSSDLAGHPVGNVVLTALWERTGDPVVGMDLAADLLGITGRVLPMATVPLEIEAQVDFADGTTRAVRGQVAVATTRGHVRRVALRPSEPPACAPAVEAVRDADWVIIGPGSWFTSVMPTLLVPDLRRALHDTAARRALVLNLEPQAGETAGFSPAQHLAVLAAHAPQLRLDVVVVDRTLEGDTELAAAAARLGARVFALDLRSTEHPAVHDVSALAAAFAELFTMHA